MNQISKKRIICILVMIMVISVIGAIGLTNYNEKHNLNSYADDLNKESSGIANWVNIARDVEDLIDMSSIIIIGKLIDNYPIEENAHVMTNQRFEVVESLKGEYTKEDEIDVMVSGGTTDGYITYPYVGAPLLDARGEYLLFLVEYGDVGAYFRVGGSQGIGLITNDGLELLIDNFGTDLEGLDIEELIEKVIQE